MSGYLLGGGNMATKIQVERAVKVINDARQVLQLVSQRPAVKKTGDRGTIIAYAELTRLKQWLEECASILLEGTPHTITTHGTSAACPQVKNGAWDYCKGHDSSREKCEHGVDLNEICRLCDPTVHMVPRVGHDDDRNRSL